MAELLEITTLGGLTIRHNGKLVKGFASQKEEELLVYLACSARSQSREVMAERLWDERSQERSLGNLRVTKSNLSKRLPKFVVGDHKTIGLDPCHTYKVDVAEFESGLNTLSKEWEQGRLSAASAAKLEQVLSLYRGDFLEGFIAKDGKGFEDWMLLERDRIRSQAIYGLHHLVNSY